MYKIKIFMMILMTALICAVPAAYADSLTLQYDGGTHEYNGDLFELYVQNRQVESDMEPLVFNDRALVPVREVFEEVGATVNYYSETGTVEIIDTDTDIVMNINDNVAYVNNVRTKIPDSAVPKLISKVGQNAKTMVPVRFISESIGMDVEFDSDNGAILIDSDSYENLPVVSEPEVTAEPQSDEPGVTDIAYEMVEEHKIKISITCDSEIGDYTYLTMSNPERLVVDLPNTRLDIGEQAISVNSGGITSIRMGQNSVRARTVVDVEQLVSYGFEVNGNVLIVYVRAASTSSGSEAQATAEPSVTQTAEPVQELNKNLIVLDPGHGGSDPGALGSLDGTRINESDLTLSIAKRVKNILESSGYSVIMTRTDDTYKTLVERPTLANENSAGLFVSIHINSAESEEANGTEVYYAASNNDATYSISSSDLANCILQHMIENMGSCNRGVKTAEHAVTKRTVMPSCLVEVGFISNADELAKMCSDSYQNSVAAGIAEGIIESAQKLN